MAESLLNGFPSIRKEHKNPPAARPGHSAPGCSFLVVSNVLEMLRRVGRYCPRLLHTLMVCLLSHHSPRSPASPAQSPPVPFGSVSSASCAADLRSGTRASIPPFCPRRSGLSVSSAVTPLVRKSVPAAGHAAAPAPPPQLGVCGPCPLCPSSCDAPASSR